MRLIKSTPKGKNRVYDIEVADVHNFYANGINVHNCATDGGTNIIKDDGTVVQGYTGSASENVDIHPDGYMIDAISGAANDNFSFYDISDTLRKTFYDNRIGVSQYQTFLNEGNGECLFEGSNNKLALAQSLGLLRIEEEFSDYASGLHNRTTSSYNTGWMHGDIKGAFLSDTDATNVTGTELVANGTFDTDISGWTSFRGAILSLSNNTIQVSGNGSTAGPAAAQEITTVAGKKYVLSGTIVTNSSTEGRIGVGSSTGDLGNPGSVDLGHLINLTTGPFSITFTAIDSGTWIVLSPQGAGTTATFDNISVRLAEEDRSVNNKGLQVFGTVTKSAVATGAELVAYGNFNSSNYLLQPYNSDLDFGTGDFCYMCWVKDNSVGNGAAIFQRGSAVNSNETVFYIDSSKRLIGRVQTTTSTATTATNIFIESEWNHCVFLRSSGTVKVYHNGREVASVSNSQTTNQSGQGLSIGAWLTNNYYFVTSISLFRVSASAPSSEQIKKIYEDEKVLFQENAACTLYGSSDAVTALAYDDSTNLLYAGTSSGRSDFQGLRRINNTTTAVTTAISASNGLVAEQ